MYGNFLVLFAMMLTGVICRRQGIMTEQTSRNVNRLVVYFAYPCLIVYTVGNMSMDTSLVKEFACMLIVSCGFFVLYGLYARLYVKMRRFSPESVTVTKLSMTLPNDGFMGFPIAMLFWGEKGLLLMIAHNAAMSLYAFSAGVLVFEKAKKKGGADVSSEIGPSKWLKKLKHLAAVLGKVMINPNILALIVGFFLYAVQIPIPIPVNEYLHLVGSIATPMAMIFIGATLEGANLREILTDKIVWETAMNRLLILPLLTIALVRVTPLYDCLTHLTMRSLVLGGCFPTAALVAMLVEQAGEDEALAGRIIFVTTVLSMGSIFLIHQLANLVI